MNTFILFGKSGGEIQRFNVAIKIAVIIKRKVKDDWVENVVELTTFSESVAAVMADAQANGTWITVTGKLSGREYNGKNYLDAIVETAFQHKAKGQAAAPKPPPAASGDEPDIPRDQLDDIPF
jgi:hypothetical protein